MYEEQMRVPPPWGLSISSNLSLLKTYKWAFVPVGFCPTLWLPIQQQQH